MATVILAPDSVAYNGGECWLRGLVDGAYVETTVARSDVDGRGSRDARQRYVAETLVATLARRQAVQLRTLDLSGVVTL